MALFISHPFTEILTPSSSSSTVTTTSDFTPPTTRLTNADPGRAGARQLLFATSTDGISFTPTGERLTAQGNVPEAVMTSDGTLYVYYIGQSISKEEENTVAAISTDNGATWTYHYLTLHDFPSSREPSDPDVVLLPNGTFRMFFTDSIIKDDIGIRYAESTDGLSFTYKGVALDAPLPVADPDVFFFNGVWNMLVIDHTPEFLFKQYRATSTDGKTFTYQGEVGTVQSPLGDFFLYNPVNPIVDGDTVRLYGFSSNGRAIQSFTSTDARTWTPAPQASLSANARSLAGGTYLQDLTVARLTDGSYLMIYVTDMPK